VTTSANLDLVRSISADWGRGEFSATGWADPEIEYVIVDGPSPGTWRGLAGMTKGFRDFLSAWDGLRLEPDEFRELDDVCVLVLVQRIARGKSSGLEMRSTGALLFQIRDGKVARLVIYWDRDRALTDLGLKE
jgi:ketosteroid isomerase-like protein